MVRVFLELGRVANLPTVWTNCVTAWVISGGARTLDLLWLCLGGTAVYLGGTFLNDVCDLKFDREHRQERAIPSGRVSARVVCVIGGGLLVAGVAVLLFATFALDWYVVGLVCSVVVYDMIHKRTALGVLFMGACRYLLYLVAASAVSGVEPSANVIWVAAAVGLYIVGLSVVARGEATGAPAAKWGMIPLAAPFVLGGYGVYIQNAPVPMVFFLVSLIWTGIAVSILKGKKQDRVGKAVERMLAGIILFDAFTVSFIDPVLALFYLVPFLLVLVVQRLVPAT